MAPRSNKSDVSVPETRNGVDNPNHPFQRMLRDMAALATVAAEDDSFRGDSLAAIYNAETDDDIWDADSNGSLNAKDLAGCELALYDLAVKYSRGGNDDEMHTPWVTSDGKKMYLLVTAARISKAGEKKRINLPAVGEQFQFNTSAQWVAAKLFTFYTRGKFGSGATMNAAIESTELPDNKTVLKLVRVPERAVSGHVANDAYLVSESGQNVPF